MGDFSTRESCIIAPVLLILAILLSPFIILWNVIRVPFATASALWNFNWKERWARTHPPPCEDVEKALPAPPPSSPAPPALEHTAYPHIMACIISYADARALNALRATSHEYLALAEQEFGKRQAVVHMTINTTSGRGALWAPAEQGLPRLSKFQLEQFFLRAVSPVTSEFPYLAARLARVRAVEVHTLTRRSKLRPGHLITRTVPNAVLRVGYNLIDSLHQVDARTVAVFWDTAESPWLCTMSNGQRRRLVVNTRSRQWSERRGVNLMAIIPDPAREPTRRELVVNFSRWSWPPWLEEADVDDVEAHPKFNLGVVMPQCDFSAFLIRVHDILKHRPENTVTLVDFQRFYAWFDPRHGCGAGRRVEDPQTVRDNLRSWVQRWFPECVPQGDRIHLISSQEYREAIGELAYEAEAMWTQWTEDKGEASVAEADVREVGRSRNTCTS